MSEEYEVYTKQVVERRYTIRLDLPVDMGDSSVRILDGMARNTDSIASLINVEEADSTDDSAEEEITFVYRGDTRIYPRLRKDRAPKEKPVVSQPDPEDVAVEDAMSSDT